MYFDLTDRQRMRY